MLGRKGLEDDGSAPAQVARRFKPTPFDPSQLPDPAPAHAAAPQPPVCCAAHHACHASGWSVPAPQGRPCCGRRGSYCPRCYRRSGRQRCAAGDRCQQGSC